jgi:hypothetical protein
MVGVYVQRLWTLYLAAVVAARYNPAVKMVMSNCVGCAKLRGCPASPVRGSC